MRFSFRLSKHDFESFHKIANRRLTAIAKGNSRLFFANLVAWIPLGFALASCVALYRKYPDMAHDLNVVFAAILIGGVALVTSMFYKQHLYRKAVLSENSWFFADQTIEVDSEGISIETTAARASYRWSSFVHGAEDEQNFYLFVDNAQALIAPKSAFDSSDQLAQFRSWSRVGNP